MPTANVLRSIAPVVEALQQEGFDVEELAVDRTGDTRIDATLRTPDGREWSVTAAPADDDGRTQPSDDGSSSPNREERTTRGSQGSPERDDDAGGEGADPGDASSEIRTDGARVESTDPEPSAGGEAARDTDADIEKAATGEPDSDSDAGDASEPAQFRCPVDGCDRTFDAEHGMRVHAAKAHDIGDETAALSHRDPERLAAVYEAHDTFEEMREALDADVTPQTVRRNMMKAGIHEPDAESGGSEPPSNGPGTADAAAGETGTVDETATGDESTAGDGTTTADEPATGDETEPADEPAASDGTTTADATPATETGDTQPESREPVEGEGRAPDTNDSDGADTNGSDDADTNDSDDADTNDSDDADTNDSDDADTNGVDGADASTTTDDLDADATIDSSALPGDVDLPPGTTVDDVAAAVRSAESPADVRRALDVGRGETQLLLSALDLQSFVDEAGEPDRAEVVDRLAATLA